MLGLIETALQEAEDEAEAASSEIADAPEPHDWSREDEEVALNKAG